MTVSRWDVRTPPGLPLVSCVVSERWSSLSHLLQLQLTCLSVLVVAAEVRKKLFIKTQQQFPKYLQGRDSIRTQSLVNLLTAVPPELKGSNQTDQILGQFPAQDHQDAGFNVPVVSCWTQIPELKAHAGTKIVQTGSEEQRSGSAQQPGGFFLSSRNQGPVLRDGWLQLQEVPVGQKPAGLVWTSDQTALDPEEALQKPSVTVATTTSKADPRDSAVGICFRLTDSVCVCVCVVDGPTVRT